MNLSLRRGPRQFCAEPYTTSPICVPARMSFMPGRDMQHTDSVGGPGCRSRAQVGLPRIPVDTYHAHMNLMLSVHEQIAERARTTTAAMGRSLRP